MRLVLALLLAVMCGTVRAEEKMAPADRSAIQRVIAAQIDVFRHDDANAAFGYAAPQIQQQFGDAATFPRALRTAYASVVPAAFLHIRLAGERGRADDAEGGSNRPGREAGAGAV